MLVQQPLPHFHFLTPSAKPLAYNSHFYLVLVRAALIVDTISRKEQRAKSRACGQSQRSALFARSLSCTCLLILVEVLKAAERGRPAIFTSKPLPLPSLHSCLPYTHSRMCPNPKMTHIGVQDGRLSLYRALSLSLCTFQVMLNVQKSTHTLTPFPICLQGQTFKKRHTA